MFDNNFGKFGPIFKILSSKLSVYTYKDFHHTCNMLLHYLVKFENPKIQHPQQTVDMFLGTL